MLFNQNAQNTPFNLVYTVALFMAAERGNRCAESPDQMSGAPADLSFSDGEMKCELKESKVNPNSAAREGLSFTVKGTVFPHRLAAETNNHVGADLGRSRVDLRLRPARVGDDRKLQFAFRRSVS